MSDEAPPAGPPETQPGYPNLRRGGWTPGESGNKSGVNRYLKKLRDAIQEQESAEHVCAVVAAMREDALAHEKFSPAAATVYFKAVGLRMEGQAIELPPDAPSVVVDYLAGLVPN